MGYRRLNYTAGVESRPNSRETGGLRTAHPTPRILWTKWDCVPACSSEKLRENWTEELEITKGRRPGVAAVCEHFALLRYINAGLTPVCCIACQPAVLRTAPVVVDRLRRDGAGPRWVGIKGREKTQLKAGM